MQQKLMLGLSLAVLLAAVPALSRAAETAPSNAPAQAAVSAPAEQTAPAAAPAEQTAAAEATLQVETAAIATGIENREPVGAAETFPAGTEKLYCYSKITGGKEGDEIVHKWMKGDMEVGSVPLKINGSPWRTKSSKTLGADAAGQWSVEILQGTTVLKTLKFEIK
jgi:hypothetical protein